jgi:hypothetical protein
MFKIIDNRNNIGVTISTFVIIIEGQTPIINNNILLLFLIKIAGREI